MLITDSISYTRLSLFIIFVLLFTITCYAELPPTYYLELQNKAPEYLKIEVIAAKSEDAGNADAQNKWIKTIYNVELEAKVQEVHRSKSGLKPGDKIRIKYRHTTFNQPINGPSEIPVLAVGNIRAAFLAKALDKDLYEPAAKGQSFADHLAVRK